MGYTLAQKILAKKSGRTEVLPGEIIWAKPDLITRSDGALPGDMDIRIDPDRIALCIDHYFMPTSQDAAKRHRTFREVAKKYGIKHFYDIGRGGIQFQLLAEEGLIRPGMLVVTLDPHVSTFGAFGTYSVAVAGDYIQALRTGEVWLKVPQTMKVNISGSFPKGVTSRDLFEKIMADIGLGGALGKVIQYTGPTLSAMSIESRMVLCNLVLFLSAETAIIEPDQKVNDYVKARGKEPVEVLQGDNDAEFVKVLNYDVSKLEPLVVVPPDVDHVKTIGEVVGIEINQACLGTCASGRMEDLRLAAQILKGRKVHPQVIFTIVPITPRIHREAAREGLLDIFWEAGAVVGPPSCAPCTPRACGWLLPGERCISTGPMNIPGRMGSTEAEIYLGNPATVAASAVEGKIADPREFL